MCFKMEPIIIQQTLKEPFFQHSKVVKTKTLNVKHTLIYMTFVFYIHIIVFKVRPSLSLNEKP